MFMRSIFADYFASLHSTLTDLQMVAARISCHQQKYYIKNVFQWKAVVMFVKCCPDHFWQGSWFTDVDRHDQWVLTEMENVKTSTSNKYSLQRFRSSQISLPDSPKIIPRIFLPYLWHITTLWVLTKERGLGMPGLQWSQKDIPVMNKKL